MSTEPILAVTDRRLQGYEAAILTAILKARKDVRATEICNPGDEVRRYGMSHTYANGDPSVEMLAAGLAVVIPQGGLFRISSAETTLNRKPFGVDFYVTVIHEKN
jgi:hypothetical protein